MPKIRATRSVTASGACQERQNSFPLAVPSLCVSLGEFRLPSKTQSSVTAKNRGADRLLVRPAQQIHRGARTGEHDAREEKPWRWKTPGSPWKTHNSAKVTRSGRKAVSLRKQVTTAPYRHEPVPFVFFRTRRCAGLLENPVLSIELRSTESSGYRRPCIDKDSSSCFSLKDLS